MTHELNHFGIFVHDLDASLRFYQEGFGAEIVFRKLNPTTQTDIVYLQIAGGMIELLHPRQQDSSISFGVDHIGFLTDDLNGDFDRLVKAGVRVAEGPRAAGTGVGRLAYVLDPNGARVELIERDADIRKASITHEHVISFDHYSLYANDLVAARQFYLDQLGMKRLLTWPIPERNLTIDYFHWDYDVLELLHEGRAMDTQFPHFALRVKDVDAAVASLAALGIQPSWGPKPLAVGSGQQVQFTDPDGATVELLDRVDLRDLVAPSDAQ